jgi:cytochrome c-type biogenesis protein
LVGIVLILFGLALFLPTTTAVDKAPNVELVDVDGITFIITDYSDENMVVMLDSMFTTCEPCAVLGKDLVKLYDQDIEDFEIISISTSVLDSNGALKKYAKEHGYDWRLSKDTDDARAAKAYGIFENPTIVIIDRDGYVTYQESGIIPLDELEEEVDRALSGEAEAIDVAQLGLIAFAFLAGLAAFFSPCSFPLLPGYITYYFKVGADAEKKKAEKAAKEGIEYVPVEPSKGTQVRQGLKMGTISGSGIVLVYFVLGIIIIPALLLGVSLSGDAISYFKPIVGTILIIMGLLTVADVTINTGYITAPFRRLKDSIVPRKGPKKPTFDNWGLFLYGVGYGSASASCSAPIFIALAVAAVSTGELWDAVITFFVFLFALWFMMVIVSIVLTISEEKVKVGMMKHYIWIKRITGVVFIIAGAYLMWLFLEAEGYISL